MANVDVRCTVNNCYFWAQDNYCAADTILITGDQAAAETTTNASTNTLVSQIGKTPAETRQQTACQTFKRR
ncbi:MAG: DUF1540 domain-containing protein [Thermaerobacter sp.]|nr:DUF1540 domain-containing protein [Thermaerobacter sp.]